ncbi:MAG: amidase, partial [Rhodospirillales bacterium]
DPKRTPGGSSSGSAASVASLMVPLALGSQTHGSTIRPAAYCGVVGYKPSFGLVSRTGTLLQSRPLDQAGLFARSVLDVALVAQTIMGFDADDAYMRPQARPRLVDAVNAEIRMPPRLAFVKGPVWDQAEAGTMAAFQELHEFLGERSVMTDLDPVYEEVTAWHRRVMSADLAKNLADDFNRAPDLFSPQLAEMILYGRDVKAVDYNLGIERMVAFERGLDEIFEQCDAILTPASTGEAPLGLDATGSPAFCTLWTFTGLPAITLPLMTGEAGMPLGVQLVGKKGDDERLLQTAEWLTRQVEDATDD